MGRLCEPMVWAVPQNTAFSLSDATAGDAASPSSHDHQHSTQTGNTCPPSSPTSLTPDTVRMDGPSRPAYNSNAGHTPHPHMAELTEPSPLLSPSTPFPTPPPTPPPSALRHPVSEPFNQWSGSSCSSCFPGLHERSISSSSQHGLVHQDAGNPLALPPLDIGLAPLLNIDPPAYFNLKDATG